MENWTYKGKQIKSLEDFKKDDLFGFVYLLDLYDPKTGRLVYKYIGKKNFHTRKKRHFGKKEKATVTDKRLKTYEIVVKESDWKTYHSSNKFIKENKGKYVIKREILDVWKENEDLDYRECQAILCNDALYNPMYLNHNVSIKRILKPKTDENPTTKTKRTSRT